MNGVRQSLQYAIAGIILSSNLGCSILSQENTGIPEIQGVWRSSDEGGLPVKQIATTYEFQQNHFRVNAYKQYAVGKYSFKMSEQGVYQLVLKPTESRNFELRKLQLQPTGGRILLINGKIYRRILRQ